MITLEEIQARISALIDQDSSAPDYTSEDWLLRTRYINMSQDEWAQLYDWSVLYKEYNTMTSTPTSNVTVALPTDFRKISGYPKVPTGRSTDEFPQVLPQQRSQKDKSSPYFYVIGDYKDGYSAVFNPATASGQFASGASIYINYYAKPTSMVSPSDVSPCPDPEYLVKRATAYLLESREDPRYPSAKVEAEKILRRMLKRETTHTESQNDNSRIRTVEETRYGFRIGRD